MSSRDSFSHIVVLYIIFVCHVHTYSQGALTIYWRDEYILTVNRTLSQALFYSFFTKRISFFIDWDGWCWVRLIETHCGGYLIVASPNERERALSTWKPEKLILTSFIEEIKIKPFAAFTRSRTSYDRTTNNRIIVIVVVLDSEQKQRIYVLCYMCVNCNYITNWYFDWVRASRTFLVLFLLLLKWFWRNYWW